MKVLRVVLMLMVLCPVASALEWNKDVQFLKDMVVYDKAFVPTLLHIRRGEIDKARESAKTMVTAWSDFEKKWLDKVNDDWRLGISTVAIRSNTVAELLQFKSDQSAGAKEELLGIRELLFILRKRVGIEYFIDFVTEVEGAMQQVVESLEGEGELGAEEREALWGQVKLAQEGWKKVMGTRIDKIVYRIDIYYMGDFSFTKADVEFLIGDLEKNVRELDRAEVKKRVDEIVSRVEHFLEILGSTPGH